MRRKTGASASTLLVVCAIIIKDGKYLIAQRPDSSRGEPSKWEFPGGKVEFRENPKDALIREIQEELGIRIGNLRVFDVTSSVHPEGFRYQHIVMISYLADWEDGEISLIECKDARLVQLEELRSYDLIESDLEIVSELLVRT
jgi:8-oxo-dGTP diphosphatase